MGGVGESISWRPRWKGIAVDCAGGQVLAVSCGNGAFRTSAVADRDKQQQGDLFKLVVAKTNFSLQMILVQLNGNAYIEGAGRCQYRI